MSPNKIFPLTLPPQEEVSFKSEYPDKTYLWHLRYGRLNNRGLHLLNHKRMLIGLQYIERRERICGKKCIDFIPKTSWQAGAPLELVHAAYMWFN